MMKDAKSFKEWEVLAKTLDDFESLNEWKNKSESKLYDYKRVQHCLASMKTLRKQNAYKTLSHMLRQDLVKNFCNISDASLYNKSHHGTKSLIQKYHKEVVKCIKLIFSCDNSKLSL